MLYSIGGMPVEDIAWGTVVYAECFEEKYRDETEAFGDSPSMI